MFASGEALADPAPAPAPEPPRPPGTVRVFVHRSPKVKSGAVRLYTSASPTGEAKLVCEAPCKADVYPNTPLQITFGDDSSEPFPIVISGTPGKDVEVEVLPPSRGALAGGIVLVSIGGLVAFIGVVLLAIGASDNGEHDLFTPGLIVTAIGGGMTAGGIALMVSRSKKPRVRHRELDEVPRTESRAITFGDDVAAWKPRSPVPAAFAPIGWSFAF
jgi:hypothetical protein